VVFVEIVREGVFSWSGIFDSIFLYIPRTTQSKAILRGNLQIASFRYENRRKPQQNMFYNIVVSFFGP
jgi:hypothetical protein